jgi:uncharacterized protein (DUF58 family)
VFKDSIFPGYARLSRASRKASRRNTDRGTLILISAVICASVGIDTGLTLVYQLFALLLCLIIVSRLSLRIQRPNVSIERHLPKYATTGQEFEYFIRVTNLGDNIENELRLNDNPLVVPPNLEQFKAEREPGEETRNAYDRWIGFHRFMWLQRLNTGITVKQAIIPEINLKATVDTKIVGTPLRRGIVHFTSTTLLCPDPFGLNYSIQNFESHDQLIVLPKRYQIGKSFELPGGRHFQPGGVNSTWSIGESDEFVSLREYRDGDSMRKIHWASTARRSKPIVKEFQDEFFVRQALILDTTTGDRELFEESVSVAASLLLQMENTDGLMDLIYLADTPQVITAGRGFAQTNHQLEALATVEKSETPVERLLEVVSAQSKIMSGCLLVLQGWDEPRKKLVQRLFAAGIPNVLFIVTKDQQTLQDVPADAHLLTPGSIPEQLASL